MLEKNTIDIDRLEWLPIPIQLQDGLQNRPLTKRQLRNWTLVLQARQIPCRNQRIEHGWQLLVPRNLYQQALEELQGFERENRNWPPPLPAEPDQTENTASTIWVLIALGLFHILSQQKGNLLGHSAIDWHSLGNADAGKILSGEWWRLVTALTLHSGGVHLTGNIVVGGIFINRLCRDLGAGLAHHFRRPEPKKLVAPRHGLELHLLVMGKLVFKRAFAIVKGAHRHPRLTEPFRHI